MYLVVYFVMVMFEVIYVVWMCFGDGWCEYGSGYGGGGKGF